MQAEFPRRSNLPAEASQSKTARSKFAPALSHEAWLQLSQFALRLAILSLEAFSETGTDAPIRESISNCLKMTGIISGSKTQLKGDGDQDLSLIHI